VLFFSFLSGGGNTPSKWRRYVYDVTLRHFAVRLIPTHNIHIMYYSYIVVYTYNVACGSTRVGDVSIHCYSRPVVGSFSLSRKLGLHNFRRLYFGITRKRSFLIRSGNQLVTFSDESFKSDETVY